MNVKLGQIFTDGLCVPTIDDPEFYRAAIDSVTAGVYLVDKAGKILFWNSGAERITGHLRQDVLGRSALRDFLGHLDAESDLVSSDMLPVSIALKDGKPNEVQVSIRHKAGHRILARLRAAPIRSSDGVILGAVEIFEESIFNAPVDERQSKLRDYGCIDDASGLMNHGLAQSHLREALATFAEHPVPFSVLCIAIDELDALKQRRGAGAGMAVIRMVGQTLENSLRPTDTIARWNDNEFLAVLIECGPRELIQVGNRLRKMAYQCDAEWWGDLLHVTVSLGGTSARASDTLESIVFRAESALKKCVELGGNRVLPFEEPMEVGKA